MPYNTRRKSLSLPSLGIHLPVSHASRAAANRSPPSTTPTSEQPPPSKKMKRSHASVSPSPMSPPSRREPTPKSILKYEHTPPPSPEAEEVERTVVRKEIDLEGINDDIVEGVIVQLQKTGNRPHLVKELAAILTSSVKIVETSANPSAIISSRLSSYLKRPCWTALAPCPLAKELETVHPRRTYFYLTTYPHQPIPDPAQTLSASEAMRFPQRTIISPSLSSAASRSDEADAERRRELSPSPEVDLSSPDFDEIEDDGIVAPPTPTGSFSGRLVHQEPVTSSVLARNHRAASPPLEGDEKEFTQTARGMQNRKLSQDSEEQKKESVAKPSSALPDTESLAKHMDLDGELFGDNGRNHVINQLLFVSSPAMKPALHVSTMSIKRGIDDVTESWGRNEHDEWDARSPENICLEELENMFDEF